MEHNHNKLIYFFLTITMLFSGMCPALLRADSLLEYTENFSGKAIISHCSDGELPETPICTAKMLGVRGLRTQQVFSQAGSGAGQKEGKQFFVSLFCVLAVFYFFCIHITGKTRQLYKLLKVAVILDYIHKTDGKK